MRAKILGKFFFRTKTTENTPCKTYVWVFADGVTVINQLFLIEGEKNNNPAWTKIYSRFGKTIYVTSMSFKYPSLLNIIQISTQILQANNIKQEDLLK